MKKENLLILADDLTGANDTGVMFAEVNFNTLLNVSPSLNDIDLKNTDVITISSDCRPLGYEAKNKTKQLIQQGIKKGITKIYLKIDSTMRGSVKHQIEGAIDAWSEIYPNVKAIICPAYPVMGRTIKNGILYVNNVPVNQTPSGKDPICPVNSSSMIALIPNSELLPLLSENELFDRIKQSQNNKFIIDANSEQDLQIISNVINKLGKSVIPVGSGGLAKKLNHINESFKVTKKINFGRSLILVTSIHSISQLQIDDYISEYGCESIVFNPSPSQLLNYSSSEKALKSQLIALINSSKNNLIIRANPLKAVNALTNNVLDLSKRISQYLADLSLFCLNNQKFDSLILFGGDGAASLLNQMKVTKIKISHQVLSGVPVGIIEEGKYCGMTVITKSGGFGKQNLLTDLIKS
ncbi:four-carbon acid sugar kinase family protein [Seminibacterium arietis]|uniref:Four-carbon acid sugar kinase family protein n=1 Tax=Seminibacterium arietis TaxID=1173502 RepID=A0ABW3IAH2_9PAST